MKLTIFNWDQASTCFFFNLLIYFRCVGSSWFAAFSRCSEWGYSALHFSLRWLSLQSQPQASGFCSCSSGALGSHLLVQSALALVAAWHTGLVAPGQVEFSRPGIQCHSALQVDSYPPCHQGIHICLNHFVSFVSVLALASVQGTSTADS